RRSVCRVRPIFELDEDGAYLSLLEAESLHSVPGWVVSGLLPLQHLVRRLHRDKDDVVQERPRPGESCLPLQLHPVILPLGWQLREFRDLASRDCTVSAERLADVRREPAVQDEVSRGGSTHYVHNVKPAASPGREEVSNEQLRRCLLHPGDGCNLLRHISFEVRGNRE